MHCTVCVPWCHVPPSYTAGIHPARCTKVEECRSHRLGSVTVAKWCLLYRCRNTLVELNVPLLYSRTITGTRRIVRHAAMICLLILSRPPLPACVCLVVHLRDCCPSHGLALVQSGDRTAAYPEAWRIDLRPDACPLTTRVSSRALDSAASTCLSGSTTQAARTCITRQQTN